MTKRRYNADWSPCQPPPAGATLRKMRRERRSESAAEATERARRMPWFARVTREIPYAVGDWYVWTIKEEA